MSKWGRFLDIWSSDDPAIVMGKGPVQAPEPTPLAVELEALPVARPVPMDPVERRARLVELVALLEANPGDTDAAESLRRLLDG